MNTSLRTWATPLVIGAFLLSAITGILMFFHVNIGLVHPAHEWLSWAMLAGVALHLSVNWRGFTRHFSQGTGRWVIALFAAMTIGALLPIGGGAPNASGGAVIHALHDSSVDTVARVAKRTPDEVLTSLRAAGLKADSPDQTIAALARDNQRDPMEVLALALPRR